jgi:hypothetical protein
MVPDLQSAEGGVVQVLQVQLSEVSSVAQYDGQQTLSTRVHEPQLDAAILG